MSTQRIIHTADSRGRADHGWLISRHTFSFADYYNPERINFGLLRVLNDDIVQAGMGFGTHPHRDMEIISIPLAGAIRHEDSMGHSSTIGSDEVQVMTAGSGITHSEFNASDTQELRFLQIWVFPERKGLTPRYDQQAFDPEERRNRLQLLIAPDGRGNALTIHQQAWFSRASLDAGATLDYRSYQPGNGVYLFVIEGAVTANGHELKRRDGLGLADGGEIIIEAGSASDILVMDVPLEIETRH